MCTNKGAQREGRFRRLEGFLSKRPDQNPNNNTLSSEKVHCRKVSATFSRSLNCCKFQGKHKNAIFPRTVFADGKNSLASNNEHMQSR